MGQIFKARPTKSAKAMPKSKTQNNSEEYFFIDTVGDKARKDSSAVPLVPIRAPAIQETKVEYKKVIRPVVVSSSLPPTDEEEDEEEWEETIHFKGHLPSSLTSSSASEGSENECESDEYLVSDDACHSSEADSDYIRNLKDNGENIMEDLKKMNLESYEQTGSSDESDDELIDDEQFAELAQEGNFLLRSPSTLMEFSLDETAAEFLSQKRRPRKGKGKGKKQHASQTGGTSMQIGKDPFDYDGPYTVGAINFKQINREFKAFVNDDVEDELEMDPMPPLPRKFIHELAHMYGLKSKSTGQGRDRHCVLFKTERSGIPRNVKGLRDFIDRADRAVLWMDKTVSKGKKFTNASVPAHVKENRVQAKGKKGGKSPDGGMSPSTKVAAGTVVGKNAKPITEDNIGNKLLQKLGWKPGEGLGTSSDGIVKPVDAVVRGRRAGLGHSHE